ncbi:MAG: hypothetical protein ACYS8L_09395 [Planctomycetota bacterium]
MASTFLESEEDFSQWFDDLRRLMGWLAVHFRPLQTKHGWRTPYTGDDGFPDWVLVRDDRMIFAELKSEKGKVEPQQYDWLTAADNVAGVEAYLWRPSDRPLIERTLAR